MMENQSTTFGISTVPGGRSLSRSESDKVIEDPPDWLIGGRISPG